VIQTLVAGGGKVIDTAHSYGRAEDRVGELVADLGARDKLFLATKYSYRNEHAAAMASPSGSASFFSTRMRTTPSAARPRPTRRVSCSAPTSPSKVPTTRRPPSRPW